MITGNLNHRANHLPGKDFFFYWFYLEKTGDTLSHSQFVMKIKATDSPPLLKMKSYIFQLDNLSNEQVAGNRSKRSNYRGNRKNVKPVRICIEER